MKNKEDPLMTVSETLEYIDNFISRQHLYNCIKSGDLRAKKLGNKIAIRKSWVDSWIDGEITDNQ